jgi:hypothetical protein
MDEDTNPESLPQVVVTIGDDGTITATVDGEMFLAGPIDRDLIGHVTASIAEQHGGPVHVEIRELDGASRTDIVTPPRLVPPARIHPQSRPDTPTMKPPLELLEVTGGGFIPGEDVAVAVILRQSSARGDGRARGVVDRSEVPDGITDVVLFGVTSGTLIRGGGDR